MKEVPPIAALAGDTIRRSFRRCHHLRRKKNRSHRPAACRQRDETSGSNVRDVALAAFHVRAGSSTGCVEG